MSPRKLKSGFFSGLSGFAALLIIFALGVILTDAIRGGWSKLSWEFFSGAPTDGMTAGGIFPAIWGTTILTLMMTVAVMPVGVLTAIYLHEYAPAKSRVAAVVRVAVQNLAGVPSIVFGLFGLGFFIHFIGENMDKAMAIILENHVESPKIQPVLEFMSDAGRAGRDFLDTVKEKSKNNDVQALALFYIALAKDAQASENEGPKPNENVTRLRDEAAEMIEKAVKLSPDVKVGTGTLKSAAAAELASMKIGVGKPVPEVEGIDLDGKKVKLSSFKGKVVLFDFWATWCPPCVAMIPHEREMVKKLSGKPFALLSVNVDEDRAMFTEFLEKEKMPWSHWVDGGRGPISKMFKIRAFPTLFLIDAKGIVRNKWTGSPGNEVMDKAIEELVAEAEKGK